MSKTVTLKLYKERFKFSSGHFTIFSATDREDCHGHNFAVHVTMRCGVQADGLAFDYAVYKRRIDDLCKKLDEKFLLPDRSEHLKITKEPPYICAQFGKEKLMFLERDALVLPISNTTLEELSHYFLDELLASNDQADMAISGVAIEIANGPGQSAEAHWGELQ